ncbi:hypothetical protein PR048_008738 [Dryococelus australis]|uniref:Uncharacterized protein n=1 Tax=Dryococelus australis TaxID=614101 RepID=A0ABQ9HYZ8_9NEOP|nr:hypothetical protein PR048_008738 [Dryococelus australis]
MYNTAVYCIVSDNAANLRKMLLAKDLASSQVASRVNTILKAFNKPDSEFKLRQHGGFRINLACETRWCSYRDAFKNLLSNLPAMKKMVATEDGRLIPEDVTKLMYDQNFIRSVEDSVQLFNPICELINVCQESAASCADAVEQWLQPHLPQGFDDAENNLTQKETKP